MDPSFQPLNSTRTRIALDQAPRSARNDLAHDALWATSTQRAWNTSLASSERPFTCPPAVERFSSIEHETTYVPDPVAVPVRSPRRYYAGPESWQANSTKFEKSLSTPATPNTVKETGTQELEFCPSGSIKGKLPGYAGHFTSSLKETLKAFRDLDEPREMPYPPLQGTINHGNVPGYTGYIPTSLFNAQYSRHSRTHTLSETTTANVHAVIESERYAPSARFPRSQSLGGLVTLTYPFNPFNSKIGSAVTGTVHPQYSQMRMIHPTVGASGI